MNAPVTALLLAAGLGKRMRPLTDTTAKPLLALQGRSLLDRALDRLRDAGVGRVVVNAHWHGDLVARHLAARTGGPHTVVMEEATLLLPGGSVVQALARGLLDEAAPFFIVNGDSAWFDGPVPALQRLADAFDPVAGDGMLMLVRTPDVQADVERGDFLLDPLGVPRRPEAHEIAPFAFSGIQIATAALVADGPAGPVGMNPFWDRAIAAARLAAIVHDGLWVHLSTPRDLAEAEQTLRERLAGVPA